jgi:3-oxoacyl-[acyl-carrier protein] reductase
MELGLRGCSILGTYSSPESAPLFETLTKTIHVAYDVRNEANETTNHHAQPELKGIVANISDPSSSVPRILECLQSDDNHDSFGGIHGQIGFIIFNAAVMGLAKMGEGGVTSDFVNVALVGNVKFPVMLIEGLVRENMINPNGRVISISSEGVRAKRPPGG